jgi:hypothetical protein
MTPVEGAVYLGVPNLHMIWIWRADAPEPVPSWRQFALPLRAMRQVVWSIAHGHGLSYTDHIFPLVAESPNVSGVILDDFFTPRPDGQIAALDDRQLDELAPRLRLPDRRLDLWCVVYEQDLAKPIAPLVDRMDVLGFFLWNSDGIPALADHLETLQRIAPTKPTVLGLYLWDYAQRRPMPPDLVEFQCNTALELLRTGRIVGITFVASCICDLELPAVEWTRAWIRRVADEPLAPRR